MGSGGGSGGMGMLSARVVGEGKRDGVEAGGSLGMAEDGKG